MHPSRFPLRWTALLLVACAGLAAPAQAQVTLRNLTLRANVNAYPPTGPAGTAYSSCWSYVHSDGREYAVLGVGDGFMGNSAEGTAIYNITNPSAPVLVGFIPGPESIWREMKQYRDWIYVVTEGTGAGEGVQIIRMTNPQAPVLAATYTGNFHRSHTVSVDTSRALLICNGTRVSGGGGAYHFSGLRVLSLANPEAPVEIAAWPSPAPSGAQQDSVYIHDSVPVGNRLYASSVYYGIQRVLDFTNPAAPTQLAAWTYAGGFTHNAWPDASGNWLYVTDEKNGEPLKVFDISNLAAPVLYNMFTPNPRAIVHNAHVWGDDLFLANYTEGIRVCDITDPAHPAEFAYADTWGGASGDYNGVWEVSVLPSGTVIASDRSSGLWVFSLQRNYGLQRVTVIDDASGLPMPEATVYRDGADSLSTTADGVAVFASDPGSHTLTARRYGYFDAEVTRPTNVGGSDPITLTLVPRPAVAFTGHVFSLPTEQPLDEAEVVVAYSPLHDHTGPSGEFDLGPVPEGAQRIEVRRPGYVPQVFQPVLSPATAETNFRLSPGALYDALESDAGWQLGKPGDTACNGVWVHADPPGTVAPGGTVPANVNAPAAPPAGWSTSARPAGAQHEGHAEAAGLYPGQVEPADDRSPAGTKCFFTGQGPDPLLVDWNDVDCGFTTLTSPAFDVSGMTMPTIGYWRWFYSSTAEDTDYLAVSISGDNGANWVPVKTTRALRGHWEEEAIRVADHVAPGSQVRVRFVAADQGGTSIVEAAIDDVVLYDAANQPLGSLPDAGAAPARLRFRAPWPQPAAGAVQAVLEIPAAGRVTAEVLDLQGRRVAALLDRVSAGGSVVLRWDGRDDRGRATEAGVYFLVARFGGELTTQRVVRLR